MSAINNCELQINKYELRINKCELQINKCELQINKCELRINKCERQINKCELRINKCVGVASRRHRLWWRCNYLRRHRPTHRQHQPTPNRDISQQPTPSVLRIQDLRNWHSAIASSSTSVL
ncbi:MAG: hypothetical protein RMX97_19085, partial [Nostoc sp. DedQUE11]|nr:hypothetical protein [Nostoc sp. DedQUE11]